MSAIVVIDHHLDVGAGVYRLVLGREIIGVHEEVVETLVAVTGPDGGPAFMVDADGEQHPAPPRLESHIQREEYVAGHEALEDYVWAADDARWQEMTTEQVVAAQRAEVKAAMDVRVAEVEADAAVRTALPGVGEAL